MPTAARRRSRLDAISIAGVRLTTRGWGFVAVALVCLIGAYGGGRQELLYVAILLVALPVIAVIVVRSRKPRLAVTRTFAPHVVQAGSPAGVVLAVRNLTTRASPPAIWVDALPWPPHATPAAILPALQPRGARFSKRGNATTLAYDLVPPRRGVFPVGPLSLELGDAFGLARFEVALGEAASIVVTPEVIPLATTGLTVPAGDGEAWLVQRRSSGDEDDAMTREYRTGDAMRRVHWRATARRGELMVRQEEQRSLPEARIIVDTQRAGYRDVSTEYLEDEAESAAFEWVVRMLASVTVHLRRAGFVVTITETGDSQLDAVILGRRRTWGDEEFLAALAGLELVDQPVLSTGRARNEGPLIAIVGSPEPETIEWMLRQRRPGEFAVAFMVRSVTSVDLIDRSFGVPAAPSMLAESLIDDGWLVVPVRADDDHASAWEAVVVETGRARGSA
jgi:uncharacterized protein (DUF58 family)